MSDTPGTQSADSAEWLQEAMASEEIEAVWAEYHADMAGWKTWEDPERFLRLLVTAKQQQATIGELQEPLDCGHPRACWKDGRCGWCVDKECCEGNLWVLGRIREVERQALEARGEATKVRELFDYYARAHGDVGLVASLDSVALTLPVPTNATGSGGDNEGRDGE